MTNTVRWAISITLLAAAVTSLVSFGLVGIGREQNFSFDYQVMHLGGLTWRDGRNPYDLKQLNATYADFNGRPSDGSPKLLLNPPFSYPPHSAALFVPLSLLSLPTATYVWWTFSLVALAGIVTMTLFSLRRGSSDLNDPLYWSVPVALIVGNPITTHVFWQGQTSLISFAASMASWFFSRRGNWMLAGVCLALASIKPQLCLFIVLWLLLERNWKVLIVAAVAAVVMSSYPTMVHGPVGAARDWLERLQSHKAFGPNMPGFEHVVGLQSLAAACGLPAPPLEPVGIVAVIGLWFARKRCTSDDLLGILMGLTVTFVFVHDAEYVALIPLFTALWLHLREEPLVSPLLIVLGMFFFVPRRFVRVLEVPVLCHWRTLIVIALLLTLLVVALREPARRRLQPT